MPHQRTPGDASGDPTHLKHALLSLLVYDPPSLWSMSELDRNLVPSQVARTGEQTPYPDVEDAVQALYAAGLVHRIGTFVFATRAAHEAEQLANS